MVLIKIVALSKCYNSYLYHFLTLLAKKRTFGQSFRMLLNLLRPNAKKSLEYHFDIMGSYVIGAIFRKFDISGKFIT